MKKIIQGFGSPKMGFANKRNVKLVQCLVIAICSCLNNLRMIVLNYSFIEICLKRLIVLY